MNAEPGTASLGAVVSVRGSVLDVRFEEHLPPIYSVLRAGADGQIVIEVLAQRDAHHVRGIALTPTPTKLPPRDSIRSHRFLRHIAGSERAMRRQGFG